MALVVPLGYAHEMEEADARVRDPRQHEAVRAIIESDSFDFACDNPFTAEVGSYVGPFQFVWYTVDGALHAVRIGKRGNILLRYDGNPDTPGTGTVSR